MFFLRLFLFIFLFFSIFLFFLFVCFFSCCARPEMGRRRGKRFAKNPLRKRRRRRCHFSTFITSSSSSSSSSSSTLFFFFFFFFFLLESTELASLSLQRVRYRVLPSFFFVPVLKNLQKNQPPLKGRRSIGREREKEKWRPCASGRRCATMAANDCADRFLLSFFILFVFFVFFGCIASVFFSFHDCLVSFFYFYRFLFVVVVVVVVCLFSASPRNSVKVRETR